MTSIKAGPHYEIPSSELATWLEQQRPERWWFVDGDPLLTGIHSFPCPADELVVELRRLHRPLLVQAKPDDTEARGQLIDVSKIDQLAARFGDNRPLPEPRPIWADDRLLYLCWKGSPHEWLLVEDSETTEAFRADEVSQAN